MASDAEMASYIADMLNPLGEVRIKRMFGEYCFYVNEKPVGFLCDNEVLVKTNAEMRILRCRKSCFLTERSIRCG